MKRNKKYMVAAVAIAMGCLVVALTPVGPAVAQGMKPLLTINFENPARQPFEQFLECNLDPGELSCSVDVTAPSGRLLVVETITGRATVPGGQSASMLASNQSTGVAHGIELQAQGLFLTGERLVGTHPVRLYLTPNATLRLFLSRSDHTGSGIFQTSISGHLVNCGAGPGCPIP
ncbi:MAG: hypothetical protein ACRD5G_10415 [Candidatus Acidiferrales bacterium]